MTKRFIGESILLTAMITVFSGSMVFAESGETAETESIESTADAETQSVVSGESEAIDYLGKELEESSDHLLRTGEDMDDLYSELTWTSVADTFPEKFDLRERGTVTPVKSQSPWGTCWSFATIAASETSILESFGLTTKSYRERFGEDLDLSEKHLAWFTTKALPDVSEYPHGEYPYDESQAGEGLHFMEEGDQEPFNMGGNYYLSTTSLSDGIGILKEKYAPYCNSEGNAEKAGDWSLPEDQRYSVSFELEGVNLLPSPATWDDHYRPEGTEAIKSELLAGRAVGVCFCADQSMPEMSKEEMREKLKNDLKDNTRASEEEKAYYIDVRSGFIDTDNLGEEELKNLIALRLRLNNMPEDHYKLDGLDHDQLAEILMTRMFGSDYEKIVEFDHKKPYMTFVGTDPVIYAQYTFEKASANHAVTVVGWDDSFSADNWPEDRRPPADGAWIVKNSWGTDWGNEGYFMLSYYDKSLCSVGTFEYVTDESNLKMDHIDIKEYDNMPAEIISSTLFDVPVYAANVFTMDSDSVLEYVSALTGDLNTTVTASIYLLDQDAAAPTDGVLLGKATRTFRYAGYHRLALDNNLLIPNGSRISIVVSERVPVEDGKKYALVNTSSLNRKGVEEFNARNEGKEPPLTRYAEGIVNPGESFVSFEAGKWTDWSEAVDVISGMGNNTMMSYDNLPIKAYFYLWPEVEKAHDLSDRVPAIGGEAAICPEDGFTLLDAAGLLNE